MDPTSGLNMSIIGVTTVFLALAMLVAVVSGLARVLNVSATTPDASAATAAASGAAPTPDAAPAGSDPRLRAVALAAFTFHHHVTRRRRFAGLVVAKSGTPWLQAGRAEQATCLPTRR